MARDRDLRRGAHRVRLRPDDAPGPAPGVQPGAQRDDSAHVLPRRHRRALVRGQRPAARLGVPPGGVGALPVRASRGGAAVRALRRALGARHRLAGTYILFHLVLKEPLIALLSPRLSTFACRGFPARSWKAVVLSLLVGIVTHFLWGRHRAPRVVGLAEAGPDSCAAAAPLALRARRRFRRLCRLRARMGARVDGYFSGFGPRGGASIVKKCRNCRAAGLLACGAPLLLRVSL